MEMPSYGCPRARFLTTFAVVVVSIQTTRAFADPAKSEVRTRPAQCYLDVKGVHHAGGICLFMPIDRTGSFKITTDNGLSAEVRVKAASKADLSWSGLQGHEATAVFLGNASRRGGCWSDGDDKKPTIVCAWDKDQHLFLGPTPIEAPASSIAWGERTGMYAQILSSSGLGTENARIVATKDKGGAIIWCRVNMDYSQDCINQTLEPDDVAYPTVTLRADCSKKQFTDFWGRHLKYVGETVIDLDNNQEVATSSADGIDVAHNAFDALCPAPAK